MNLTFAMRFTRRVSLRALVLATAASLLFLASFSAFPALAQEKPDADEATRKKPLKAAQNTQPAPAQREALKSALKGKEEAEGSDFLRRRANWFFQPRAYPIGFIPRGARERALQQMRQMYQREGRLGFLTPAEIT